MASIGGLSSGASNGITGTNYKGFGGLASGLDRDSLIEQMTMGTQSKIQKQKQAKQKVTWQQDTIRDITNKMVEFSQKYLTFSSSTNLLSSGFFSKADIESLGANSKAVSISGNSSLANEMSVTGIKQLAENAKLSSTLSSNTELSGTINGSLSDKFSVSKLAGESFSIKVGGSDEYRISISNDNIANINDAVDAINKELEKIDLKTGAGKLSEKIQFSVNSSGKVEITNLDQFGNDITLQSGENVFRALGVLDAGEGLNPYDNDKKIMISNGSPLVAKNAPSVTEEKTKRDLLAGTELTFNYNGERKTVAVEGKFTDIDGYVKELQSALDKAYGEKHIKVTNTNGKISFGTVDSAGNKDAHSTLTIESASQSGVLGKTGVLGIEAGTGNRFNVNQSMKDLGFNFTNGEGSIFVNDKEIKFKEDTTLQEVMDKIGSEAGVNIRYFQTLDRVTITSAGQGAGSRISFGKQGTTDTNSQQFLDMFKIKGTADGSTLAQGKDAILSVKYPGIDDIVEITRSSNSFKLDGMDFKLNSTFGYDEQGAYIKGTEAVTFKSKANTEDTTKAVKEMVEAFNSILSDVNDACYTKQTGKTKYEPLTDQQKKDMTESQITEWEKKAKVGILYGDTDLKSLSNSLRFVMSSGDQASATIRKQLSEIGISVSTNYSDKGKLVFDEEKFKKAMETNSESVANAIAGGLMRNVKDVMDRYAKVSGADKGILINRAGSKHSPVSMTKNIMQTKMDSIQKMIDKFEVRLQKDQTRYSNQFTQLEKMISKMNTQSSWLNQQ